ISTNKTCAISSLRWRPVSALIYGFAYSSKHESVLPLSPKFPCNNRKQKNSSILKTRERKGWTVSQRRDNPDPGAGIICRLSNRRRHDKVSWVLPRRWRDYSALLAVMNKQSTLDQDQRRRRSRVKLRDLPAKKNLKGGSTAKSAASVNGSPGIPTSLQEFLKR